MKKLLQTYVLICLILLVPNNSFALQKDNNGRVVGITKVTIPACLEKKDFEKILQFMFVEKDYNAASDMTSYGRCVLIAKNEKLTIQSTHLDNIRVRRRGSVETYWTSRVFVE